MSVREILEQAREKRLRANRLEDALSESVERVSGVSGLAITERVQTSVKATLDGKLAALEEERARLEEARKEADALAEEAKGLINLIREDETAWHILWCRYIRCMGWRCIAREMHYGRASCFRIAWQGLEKIEKMRLHETP